MGSILSCAEFGNKFKTRDGRVAIYKERNLLDNFTIYHTLLILLQDGRPHEFLFNDSGCLLGAISSTPLDIVGIWLENEGNPNQVQFAKEYATEISNSWLRENLERWNSLTPMDRQRFNQFIQFDEFARTLYDRLYEALLIYKEIT